ncbi:MAG: alpha/beta hydrolase [Ilumatobacteraceae bacterium]
MPLHPQARSLIDLIDSIDEPPIEQQDPATARASREALIRPSAIEVGEHRDLDAGGVPARLYRPTTVSADDLSGLLVWFHGGGWVLGSVAGHDDLCRALCVASGHRVLSVEYRLAPEDPFPAGLTDAINSTRWAHAHAADLGVDPSRIAVGGDSAGGNLAAAVAQLAPVPLRYQTLVYPVLDARRTSASYRDNAEGCFLTATAMGWFIDHYLSGGQGTPDDPRVSPALAPDEAVAASPPGLVITAQYDVLHDEGAAYADRLAANGVVTSHVTFHGQIHGFVSMADLLDDAHAARGLIGTALARALGPT